MTVTLSREDIELATRLGEQTLARYIAAYGEYNNTFNNHVKGRFGELAVDKLFQELRRTVEPYYKDAGSDRLCDLVVNPARFQRLEVKTWSAVHWTRLGRCISIKQAKTLARKADIVIWCTVPLHRIERPQDLSTFQTLDVSVRAYSLPSDVTSAPISLTGEPGMRKILNHQVDEALLRDINEVLVLH